MAHRDSGRRLIVNADDFGKSPSINEAIIRAHREGILTSASLMVNGDAFQEAVTMAKATPSLGVGLHLTLVCGKSTLPHGEIPGLVDPFGNFSDSPVKTGFRYFATQRLRGQLRYEIAAQFKKFHATDLPLDHVNGHLNMHLHPTVFSLLSNHYLEWGIGNIRLTRDPYSLNARVAPGPWFYRRSHSFIFNWLSARAEPSLRERNIRYTDRVFGLLQNARVNEQFLTALLPLLPKGDSELYCHPSLDAFKHEFAALTSPRVRDLIDELGIALTTYRGLGEVAFARTVEPDTRHVPFAKARRKTSADNSPEDSDKPRRQPKSANSNYGKTNRDTDSRPHLRSYRGGLSEQGFKANRRGSGNQSQ